MTEIKKQVVEPIDDADSAIELLVRLVDAGWPREDAGWLAELCADVLRTPSPSTSGSDHAFALNTALIARSWRDSGPLGHRDMALLQVYARLIGCGGKGAELATPNSMEASSMAASLTVEGRRKVAATMRAHGADFERALVSVGWPGNYSDEFGLSDCQAECRSGVVPAVENVPSLHRLMRSLVKDAQLDLAKVIRCVDLMAPGPGRQGQDAAAPWRIPQPSVRNDSENLVAPRSLTAWLIALGTDALSPLLTHYDASSSESRRSAIAFGIKDAIEGWLRFASGFPTRFQHVGRPLAKAVLPICERLDLACGRQSASGAGTRLAWLWFGRCAAEADATVLDDAHCSRLLRAANEELARLRPLFARASSKSGTPYLAGEGHGLLQPGEVRAPWEEFEWEKECFDTYCVLLYELGGVWAGMKPLLLALRSLSCPAVASDLRYWTEPPAELPGGGQRQREQPPEPWSIIPATMINLFHGYVGREQAEDVDLVELRSQLAAFCLRGLADRWTADERIAAEREKRQRTNDDMLERSPHWRYCLVRAAMALHVNPEGRAHRLLHAASKFDPDREVQEVAHEAHEMLRRSKGLPPDVSPRRCVMTALWWVRQAHLLALDARIDPDGAQRTRAKELTRTKDQERAEHQRTQTDNN